MLARSLFGSALTTLVLPCRFVYGNIPLYQSDLAATRAANEALPGHSQPLASMPEPFKGDSTRDDAWSTLMQWLYYRAEQIMAAHA